VDTQVSSFYGHVMQGLVILFLYFSQPNASKICSFINSCIHLSPFWVFGKIFTAFTFQVNAHFFQKKLVLISEFFFQRKVGSYLFSKTCWFFLTRQLIIVFFFFLPFSFFPLLSYYHLFISFSPFFSFSL